MLQHGSLQQHASGARRCTARHVRPQVQNRRRLVVNAGVLAPGDTVLVAGATGGVGQVVTAKLLERGYKVRAIARSSKKSTLDNYGPNCEVVVADLREASQVAPLLDGVSAVVSATGTTAFPSDRWNNNNGPKPTDKIALGNLINATKGKNIKRFVLVTSAGVERQKEFPYAILNLFGVLKYKRESEQLLESSGTPYTLLRPARLTDGPYTSYDLNTLLKATAGTRQDVQLAPGDQLSGEASRIAVAEAAVQSLLNPRTENRAYCIISKEGEGPGQDQAKWDQLFAAAQGSAADRSYAQA